MENYNVGATSSVLNSTKHEVCYIESSQAVSLAVLTVLLSIIGTLGNILVLGAVYTTRALQTISNYLLVSMALADLIVTALAQPLFAAFLSAGADGSCTETVEFLFRLFSNASCAASVLNLCVISLERAVIILKPYTYHRLVTKAKFKISIVVIWLIPILYSIMRVVVQKKRVTSMFTVAVMAICFLIIFVSYAIILVQVHRQRKSTRRLRGSKKNAQKTTKAWCRWTPCRHDDSVGDRSVYSDVVPHNLTEGQESWWQFQRGVQLGTRTRALQLGLQPLDLLPQDPRIPSGLQEDCLAAPLERRQRRQYRRLKGREGFQQQWPLVYGNNKQYEQRYW